MATTMTSPVHMTIAVPHTARREGFFTRLKLAIIASRTKAAEREVARYMRWHDELRNPHALLGLPKGHSKDALPF